MDGRDAAREAYLDFVRQGNWRSRPSELSDSSADSVADMEQHHDDAAGAVGGVPPQLPQIQPRMSPEQLEQLEVDRLHEKLTAANNDPG